MANFISHSYNKAPRRPMQPPIQPHRQYRDGSYSHLLSRNSIRVPKRRWNDEGEVDGLDQNQSSAKKREMDSSRTTRENNIDHEINFTLSDLMSKLTINCCQENDVKTLETENVQQSRKRRREGKMDQLDQPRKRTTLANSEIAFSSPASNLLDSTQKLEPIIKLDQQPGPSQAFNTQATNNNGKSFPAHKFNFPVAALYAGCDNLNDLQNELEYRNDFLTGKINCIRPLSKAQGHVKIYLSSRKCQEEILRVGRIYTKRGGVCSSHKVVELDLNKEVKRCFKCQEYGHLTNACRNSNRCGKCANKTHETIDCEATHLKCANCDGKHESGNKVCPKQIKAVESLRNFLDRQTR